MDAIIKATELIKNSKNIVAFTGAGISVESGIPPFRGENGLWSKFDPSFLELSFFYSNPEESWRLIKDIFYEYFGKAKPNKAHYFLAKLEKIGKLIGVITQNIDNLHQEAGSTNVVEYHGNSKYLVCTKCGEKYNFTPERIEKIPPLCEKCKGVLKPDFIFFGEGIPVEAIRKTEELLEKGDLLIVIGTTGEVYPAGLIPIEAKNRGMFVIEINPDVSKVTPYADVFLKMKATEAAETLEHRLGL
ncbi:NAD-dependent deacetylase [Thermotomaculum hydrothermale]|uniref:protein acetyllysine N-acetyltransferase n=1 Tax=Thermotomaculum hydrothermale TaxID=981385 RepID=A0A7R6SYS4_9BACT|nr:NAD-dependent deacylase [Thermotomaculum hydrothermale]BBB32881.1 NAD-dependent deacetylase [Thermotomaculum hydrothermale]